MYISNCRRGSDFKRNKALTSKLWKTKCFLIYTHKIYIKEAVCFLDLLSHSYLSLLVDVRMLPQQIIHMTTLERAIHIFLSIKLPFIINISFVKYLNYYAFCFLHFEVLWAKSWSTSSFCRHDCSLGEFTVVSKKSPSLTIYYIWLGHFYVQFELVYLVYKREERY